MDAGTLPGLHLLVEPAIALCALAALALGSLVAGGFALLWHSGRGARRLAGQTGLAPRELGLPAIWRLQQGLRPRRPTGPHTSQHGVSSPAGARFGGRSPGAES